MSDVDRIVAAQAEQNRRTEVVIRKLARDSAFDVDDIETLLVHGFGEREIKLEAVDRSRKLGGA